VWHELIGSAANLAGTSGTLTVPSGGIIVGILAHASAGGASVSIFGAPAFPIVSGAAPTWLAFNHTLYASNSTNSGAVTFTGTDVACVFYIKQGFAP
jgi:hypothetical protein